MRIVKWLLWIAVIVGAICGILYLTVFDVWRVPDDAALSVSLEPNVRGGDLLVISRRQDSERGHLVRCADPRPENPGQFVIGRIIGVKEEEVAFSSEVVTIDGKRTPSPFACEPATLHDPRTDDDVELTCSTEETGEKTFAAYRAAQHPEPASHFKVEPGRVFLVSDNRHMHQDSRDFGSVDQATCQHALFRLWGKQGIADAKTRFSLVW